MQMSHVQLGRKTNSPRNDTWNKQSWSTKLGYDWSIEYSTAVKTICSREIYSRFVHDLFVDEFPAETKP